VSGGLPNSVEAVLSGSSRELPEGLIAMSKHLLWLCALAVLFAAAGCEPLARFGQIGPMN
jgi:hypothetical protein